MFIKTIYHRVKRALTGLSLARHAHGLVLPLVRPLAALSAVVNTPALAALEAVHVLPALPAESTIRSS